MVIVRVAVGASYSAAITQSGNLYSWGCGELGRLGLGHFNRESTPQLVEYLADVKIVDVSCGGSNAHTLCVTQSGAVYAWGDGEYGKKGTGTFEYTHTPVQVEISNIKRVIAGSQFSMALSHSGVLYTW